MADRTRLPAGRGDYEVGYRRPPVARRFVKGTSGNPGGRPKSRVPAAADGAERRFDNPMQDALLKVMAEMVECEVSPGRRRRVPRYEALVRELVTRAVYDPRSFKHLIEMYAQAHSHQMQVRVAQEEERGDTARIAQAIAQLLRSRPDATAVEKGGETECWERLTVASGADFRGGIEADGIVGDVEAVSSVVSPSGASKDARRDVEVDRRRLSEPTARSSSENATLEAVSGDAKARAGGPAPPQPAARRDPRCPLIPAPPPPAGHGFGISGPGSPPPPKFT